MENCESKSLRNIILELLEDIDEILSNIDYKKNSLEINDLFYNLLKKIFKNIIELHSSERNEVLIKVEGSIKKIVKYEEKLKIKFKLKELEQIIENIIKKNYEQVLKLSWYYVYRKSIYTIKVFDTENLSDKLIVKCAWYASLFKAEDAIEIKNTKFYLIDKKTNEKIPIEVKWGNYTYYKYDFPHEKIVNPYDNMSLIIDFKILNIGDFEIYYEVFGLNGKVIISNAAVTRKFKKRIIKEERLYKSIHFRVSSRVIYLSVYKRRKSIANLIKIKLKQFRYDIRLIKRLDNRRLELILIYMFFYLIKLICRKKNVLIGELPGGYEDSGSVLFEELQKGKQQFRYYFVTNRKDLLNSNKKFVKFGSLKHRMLFLISDVLLNVQNIDLYMNPFMKRNEKYVAKRNPKDALLYLAFSRYLSNQKRIFLQHGVLYQSGLTNAVYVNSDFDYLVVSAEFEKKVFPTEGREFIETCLPRFSRYEKNNIKSNKILFSPTWRKNFKNIETGEIDIQTIKSSQYYNKIIEFIYSNELINILKKYDYKLIYNVHHTLKEIVDLDLKDRKLNERITIKDENTNLNDLISECDICITDYSSLFFDFLWQNKPVIHYIYDYDEFHQSIDNNKKINEYFNIKKYKNSLYSLTIKDTLGVLEKILRDKQEFKNNDMFFYVNNPSEKFIKKINKIIRGNKN